MARLEQAGLITQLWSYFAPKRLAVEVRSATLPNGQVELTPVYTVDGLEIPADLVNAGNNSVILGHRVVADPTVADVHSQTQGKTIRVSKRQAGPYLSGLKSKGVKVCSKDGRSRPTITTVKPDVSAGLDQQDRLTVESTLATPVGVVIEKPTSLDELKRDDGWFSIGDDLVHIATTNTILDDVLLRRDAPTQFTGDQVPELVKELQNNRSKLGDIEKNPALEGVKVREGEPEHQAKVDGDNNRISIDTALVLKTPEGEAVEAKDLNKSASPKRFHRVPSGWVEVPPQAIQQHEQATQELARKLGKTQDLRGAEIPEALKQLLDASRKGSSWQTPWAVYFSQAVKDAHRVIETPSNVEFRLNIVESDGRSLLSLDPIYNHERFQLTHAESQEAVAEQQGWVRKRGAWVKVDADKFGKVKAGIDKLGLQPSAEGFTFAASDRERVLSVFSILGTLQHSEAYARFLAQLADFEKIESCPLPKKLRDGIRLREYQKHGYDWLAFLRQYGLNGILADDMGLGKTLQTLAIIHYAVENAATKLPSLIICPTSVVQNWRAEAEKFFQGCEVLRYTGTGREAKLEKLLHPILRGLTTLQCRLVITSYDIARRDRDILNRVPWLYVVVDEGHNIKNPDADRTKAIKTINGQHKLALTGTPIQNNLEELWSLFDYAMPGYLGNRARFRETYSRNGRVDWEQVKNGKTPLKDRIHPFILRRLKENVAKDLPAKIIIERPVELTALQTKLYKEVLASAETKNMLKAVEQNGVARSKVFILAALTKLRTICNHPALCLPTRPKKIDYRESGKLEDLQELMEEVIDGEHRALLFSQSTEMLDIIEDCFAAWGVKTLRLCHSAR